MKVRYTPEDYGDVFNDAFCFNSVMDEDDLDYIAQEVAEEYHHEHDGWESTWPIVFRLWAEDGRDLGRFQIEREFEPTFSAERLADSQGERKR